MKAIIIDEGPAFDNLKLVNRPMPEPGRSEVVLKLRAASLNYRDLDMVMGTYPSKFPLPLVPLSDGVGEVVAVGDGVTRVKKGDRVVAEPSGRDGSPAGSRIVRNSRRAKPSLFREPAGLRFSRCSSRSCSEPGSIITSSSDAKLERARALGATATIN